MPHRATRTNSPAASASASPSRGRWRSNPKLIVADEPVSALDVSIQSQIINLIVELRERLDLSMLFISHDLSVIRHVSDRIAVMYLGRIVETGATESLMARPLTPTRRRSSPRSRVPSAEGRRERIVLKGELPDPAAPAERLRLPHPLPVRHAALLGRPALPSSDAAGRRHRARNTACHLYEPHDDRLIDRGLCAGARAAVAERLHPRRRRSAS